MDNNPAFKTADLMKNYVNLRIDITLLAISNKMSHAAGYFVFAIIIGFIALFVSLFLSLSLSEWLADVLNMPGMGNLIVSLIYIILGIIIFIFKKPLILDPIHKNIGGLVDMSDLNSDSAIQEDLGLEGTLEHLKQNLEDTESSFDQNMVDIKDYYSFDQLKNRFITSITSNPQNILNGLLILREIIVNRKKKK